MILDVKDARCMNEKKNKSTRNLSYLQTLQSKPHLWDGICEMLVIGSIFSGSPIDTSGTQRAQAPCAQDEPDSLKKRRKHMQKGKQIQHMLKDQKASDIHLQIAIHSQKPIGK